MLPERRKTLLHRSVVRCALSISGSGKLLRELGDSELVLFRAGHLSVEIVITRREVQNGCDFARA